MEMFKKACLFVSLFFSFINLSYAYDYRLQGDEDYYLEINKEKYLTDTNYEEVKKQIEKQYTGQLKPKKTRPEFDLYEYFYTTSLAVSVGKTADDNIKYNGNKIETSYKTSENIAVSLGMMWYSGQRVELEVSFDDKKSTETNGNSLKTRKYFLNGIFENTYHNAKLTPYIGVGVGMLEYKDYSDRNNKSHEFAPSAQGLLGFSYKFEANIAFFVQYKYTTSLTETSIRDRDITYNNHAVDIGFRIFQY